MARRSYGTGSLYVEARADGSSVYVGKFRNPAGRQVKRVVGPVRDPHTPNGLTKKHAEARLREIMQAEHVVARAEGRRSLQDATALFLGSLTATGAKKSTHRAYAGALNRWWLPTLGDRSLDRISAQDVEDVISRMRVAGLADKTILNCVGVLRALFNYAMAKPRRWAAANPVEDVTLPKKPTYAQIQYLTPDELWMLVEKAPTPLDRALYLAAGMTGLRIGELQALDWRSVDFAHSRIRVRRTWDAKEKEFTAPKTLRSERAVPMPDVVARELLLLAGDLEPPADGFVFGDPATGQPMHWRPLYGNLRAAQDAAGIDPAFGFHAMRHGYGTALAAQGVPMRTLQEWMGHTDIQTTQRYADYIPNPRERDVVEAAFAQAGPGTRLDPVIPGSQGGDRPAALPIGNTARAVGSIDPT